MVFKSPRYHLMVISLMAFERCTSLSCYPYVAPSSDLLKQRFVNSNPTTFPFYSSLLILSLQLPQVYQVSSFLFPTTHPEFAALSGLPDFLLPIPSPLTLRVAGFSVSISALGYFHMAAIMHTQASLCSFPRDFLVVLRLPTFW